MPDWSVSFELSKTVCCILARMGDCGSEGVQRLNRELSAWMRTNESQRFARSVIDLLDDSAVRYEILTERPREVADTAEVAVHGQEEGVLVRAEAVERASERD